MNDNSEIIIEKMIDHFGEWEEPKKKTAIKLKKKVAKLEEVEKKVKKVVKRKIQTQYEKARREEILILREELKSLNQVQLLQAEVTYELYEQDRQAQLLYVKEVLKEEVQKHIFIMAS